MKLHKGIVKGSIILLIVFNIYNFLNFIFQASMAHFLTVAEYGILAALSYLAYCLSIFSESIQTVMAKYASTESDQGRIKNMLKRAVRKITPVTFVVFCMYLVASIFLSRLIEIPYTLFLINGFLIFSAFYLPITRGILQGQKRFGALGANLIVEASLKVLLATLFVWIGWKVYGAVGGIILGPFIALIFSFLIMSKVFKSEEKPAHVSDIYNYSKPVFLIMFSLLVFYTIDFLIAQIVFTKEVAGYYAIAAILSKMIFWGTQPVSKALLPMSANESAQKQKNPSNIFLNALGIVTSGVVVALAVFYFFPNFIIDIFSGKTLEASSNILFYLGVGTSILSFANLTILYKISIGKVRNAFVFPIVLVIGVGLLMAFSSSLVQFSMAFIISSLLFLLAAIFFLRK